MRETHLFLCELFECQRGNAFSMQVGKMKKSSKRGFRKHPRHLQTADIVPGTGWGGGGGGEQRAAGADWGGMSE